MYITSLYSLQCYLSVVPQKAGANVVRWFQLLCHLSLGICWFSFPRWVEVSCLPGPLAGTSGLPCPASPMWCLQASLIRAMLGWVSPSVWVQAARRPLPHVAWKELTWTMVSMTQDKISPWPVLSPPPGWWCTIRMDSELGKQCLQGWVVTEGVF